MPILNEARDDAPLTQGDVLKDIPLFATGQGWSQSGESPTKVKSPLCLVLSRPCALLHQKQIIVAAIERNTTEPPREVKIFEKVHEYLVQLRDGFDTPDRFYLGQIPGFPEPGRYFARLDSLYTLRMPPAKELPGLLAKCRIAELNADFQRDLHRRIFSAFAVLGFDDYGWYSDEDLKWLVQTGETELSQLETQIKEKESQISRNHASGTSDRNENLTREVDRLSEKLTQSRQELTPYQTELACRSGQVD